MIVFGTLNIFGFEILQYIRPLVRRCPKYPEYIIIVGNYAALDLGCVQQHPTLCMRQRGSSVRNFVRHNRYNFGQ